MTRIKWAAAVASSALVLSACSSVGRHSDPASEANRAAALEQALTSAEANVEPNGLVEVPSEFWSGPGKLFVKPPADTLDRFHAMLFAPAKLTYARRVPSFSDHLEARLLDRYDAALERELIDGERWSRSDEPGPAVLRVSAGALDLEVDSLPSSGTSDVNLAATNGEALLLVEMRDSQSGELLLRFGARRRLPGGFYPGTTPDADRLAKMFNRFAIDLHAVLEVLPTKYGEAIDAPDESRKPTTGTQP